MANLPLHSGKCPAWLFGRMKRLGAAIIEIIVEEFGPGEVLRRLADPVWFQALGCVLGFDWHSSGVTTTVCGALKEGLRERQGDLGIFLTGGKGAASRKTPQEVLEATERYGLSIDPAYLQYASRMAAKVDTAGLQDGYDIYHHLFIFTAKGEWAVVQQGMNESTGWARRYHWLSQGVSDFVCEPHAGICSDRVGKALNLVARESDRAREASTFLAREGPKVVLRELELIAKSWPSIISKASAPPDTSEVTGPRVSCPGSEGLNSGAPFRDLSSSISHRISAPAILSLPSHHWIPSAAHLERALRNAYDHQPRDFEALLAVPGVGPATIRTLALVAEVAYGAEASFRDPVKYSFAHGGKDGTPYPVDRPNYDRTIAIVKKAVEQAKLGNTETAQALKRLARFYDF